MVFYIENCWVSSCSACLNGCLITCCYMKILRQGASSLQNHMVITCQAGVWYHLVSSQKCSLWRDRQFLSELEHAFKPFCEPHFLPHESVFMDLRLWLQSTCKFDTKYIFYVWPRAIFRYIFSPLLHFIKEYYQFSTPLGGLFPKAYPESQSCVCFFSFCFWTISWQL